MEMFLSWQCFTPVPFKKNFKEIDGKWLREWLKIARKDCFSLLPTPQNNCFCLFLDVFVEVCVQGGMDGVEIYFKLRKGKKKQTRVG